MKGLFIPGITAEMFRNGCLESIETLMAEGDIYDIEYPLEQEPCEDRVSRKDVEDMIFRMGSVEELEIDFAKLLVLRRELKKLPSVKPTAQKGRWVHHNDDHFDWLECPFCGYGDEGEVVYGNETPFCPMCGADLSEASE